MATKMLNGVSVELTAEEQAEHEAAQAAAQADNEARAIVIAQKATDKASGNQKLLDLGLSQAEVDALTK
tara:strand:- start:292 stop:498 length:207 start_codon:yes stop_codon:yes gene_type:complete